MKKIFKYTAILVGLTSILCLYCTKNIAGGTEVGNPSVSAILYNPGGSPAAHAKVRFYPIHYNPRTGGLAKKLATADSATTDSTGNYSVKLDTGTYNVLASGDSGVVYQDSITVTKDSAIHPPADTLKAPGGLRGRVQLQPGDDARNVFILFFGTNTWCMPDDSIGSFGIANMAQGTYRVRILTTLNAYVPKDTVLSVTAGKIDTLAHDIILQYTGIPGPTGLTVSYDTLRQTVILAWTGADTFLIDGYNLYRAIKGQNFTLITQTPLPDTVTTYRDSNVSVGNTYAYRVVSWRVSGQESPKVAFPGDTMKAVSSSLVTTSFTWNLNNTIIDTASINDTIKACLAYSNPTRKIAKIVWYTDSLSSPVVKQQSDSSLAGKDTLAYSWKQAGNKKIFVKVTDGAGTAWTDSVGVVIIQDVPVITFISVDTIINHGGTVRCSVYVQQKFGTMAVGIDTANSGTYKNLGSLGLSGGEAYSFSTGNVCSWDSVKVRITDDDGNAVEKGFRVRIRPRPLTITSVDSTVNTITVRYGQSQETDFTQYRIYRNTTNAVDTNSELWATISVVGTVSYTTPSPGYAWEPRYYRVYQIDSEGVWSAGSNTVYGCIVNSPPTTPLITSPLNNGDSVWIDSVILGWHSVDPNGNGVRYRVLVNYDNTGYAQYATALVDTFIQLTGYDSLSFKFKVIAYDTLGDSSAWSAERTAFIRPGISDIDGNAYRIVKIGTQVWTVENLRTTRFKDGAAIPYNRMDTVTPGYYWYGNNSATYGRFYGPLYNQYSVNTGKLAPTGWHVPTDSEWSVLTTYLGGDAVAGGKLKEMGTENTDLHPPQTGAWYPPNTGATNETGFSALPGGCSSCMIGDMGFWWTATGGVCRAMVCDSTDVRRFSLPMSTCCSIRCVRDY
jgi:uncharacterized protein (TIGR02145 family)